MKNSTNSHVQDLLKWWNGRVFSFDTTKIQVKADDVESGMDEAELFLEDDDFLDSQVVSRHENNNTDEDFIGTFDGLTISMQGSSNQPLSSHTVADPHASSYESQFDSEPQLDSEPRLDSNILQPESVTQNPQTVGKPKPAPSRSIQKARGGKAKGKQKAAPSDADLVEAEGLGTASEKNLRSRIRK